MPGLDERPPIGAWCPGCETPFDLDGEVMAWNAVWGEPTDHIPDVDDPEDVADEWRDAFGDEVEGLCRLAELAQWRGDRLLELHAVAWLAGWGLRDLAQVATDECIERMMQLLEELTEMQRQAATRGSQLADWYAEVARWHSAADEQEERLAWWRAALQALPPEAIGDPADEIRADGAHELYAGGASDEALQMAEDIFPRVSESAGSSIPAMIADLAAQVHEDGEEWAQAFAWWLAVAHCELREIDLRRLLPHTAYSIEACAQRLSAPDRRHASQQIGRVAGQLDLDDERHQSAREWLNLLSSKLAGGESASSR